MHRSKPRQVGVRIKEDNDKGLTENAASSVHHWEGRGTRIYADDGFNRYSSKTTTCATRTDSVFAFFSAVAALHYACHRISSYNILASLSYVKNNLTLVHAEYLKYEERSQVVCNTPYAAEPDIALIAGHAARASLIGR